MPDINVRLREDAGVIVRYRDMGDGTFAPMNAMHPGAAGAAEYPLGATPVHASAAVANATATASLPGVASKTTYCAGVVITGGGATAAALVTAVLSGLKGGSASFVVGVGANPAAANEPLVMQFRPPIPASNVNVAIDLNVPAYGAGNTASTATLYGFQL
jgi:hypothetical protein